MTQISLKWFRDLTHTSEAMWKQGLKLRQQHDVELKETDLDSNFTLRKY